MSEKVRIGVAGCGLFGESHLQAYRAVPNAEIHAVYDVDRSRAEEAARVFSVPKICASLEELIGLPELDAIDVVTPEETHLEPLIARLPSCS